MVDKKEVQVVATNAPATQEDQYFQIVNMAMAEGNLDQVERMMQLKKEFEKDQAQKAFNLSMAKFRSTVPSIVKDQHVSYNNTEYFHESLDGIMKVISPSLSGNGLSVTYRSTGNITVTCRVSHELGHYEETSLTSSPDKSGGKNDVQAIGSIITYLQRYTLKLLLGLSAGHDNDANNPPEITYINDQQIKDLEALMKKAGKTEKQCLSHWSGQAKIELSSLSEIPDSIYESCTKLLERAITKNQEAQS